MTDIRPGTNTQDQFFNPKNEAMLDRLLYADFQRRIGGDLNEKQQQRLNKTVKHYMTEVYGKHPDKPTQYLNKEVLQSVVPDYMSYLKRSNSAEADDSTLHMDVSARFGKLQADRQTASTVTPTPPDFRVNMDSDGPSPLTRFEELKRIREEEAAREAENASTRVTVSESQEIVVRSQDVSMGRFVNSDVDFRNGAEAARQRDQLSLIMREAERGNSRTEIVGKAPPDPRALLLGEGGQMPPTLRSQGIAIGNPTLAIPDSYRDRSRVRKKTVVCTQSR